MLVVVDTDVVSKLALMSDFKDIGAILRHHVIHVTTSETVAKEVLAITDTELRAVIAHTLLDMLGEYPLLASLPYQVKWGIQSFLTGRATRPPRLSETTKGRRALSTARDGGQERFHHSMFNVGRSMLDVQKNSPISYDTEFIKHKMGIPIQFN